MRHSAPLLALLLALLPACTNECDAKCDAEADLLERCFPEWGSSWSEEGFADREGWLDRCYAVWGDQLDGMDEGSSEYSDFEDRCARQRQAAISDTDCETPLLVEP